MAHYGSLGLQIKAHWRQYRPTLYRELIEAGTLDEAVSTAEELTADARYRLTVEQRLPYDQAWEMVREEWAFLPESQSAGDSAL